MDTNIVNTMEEVILFFIWSVSCLTTALDRSGTSAIESEPVRADGMKIKGSVMPIAIP